MLGKFITLFKNESPAIYKLKDFSKIGVLFHLGVSSRSDKEEYIVDEDTWNDLDMSKVFLKIDKTKTSIGQLFLYQKMRTIEPNEKKLQERWHIALNDTDSYDWNTFYSKCLSEIKYIDGSSISKLLFEKFPIIRVNKLISLWGIASITTLFMAFFQGGGFLALSMIAVAINFYLSQKFVSKAENTTYGFYGVYEMLIAAQKLYSKDDAPIPEIENLKNKSKTVSSLKFKLLLLANGQASYNIFIGYFAYFANLVCALDLIIYSLTIQYIKNNINTIKDCFNLIGKIDSNLALVEYMNENKDLCRPKLDNIDFMYIEEASHPLIMGGVTNTYESGGRSALITGSNMAGKTSFIKTIGVNYILSRTLWICHAKEAGFPLMSILSSIKNSDAIDQGKSYYFSELEKIYSFLIRVGQNKKYLFLIDEIFRGTNTAERVAGAAAVLKKLSQNSTVLVTSHDRELSQYLSESFDFFHFEETGSPSIPFDYKLKKGLCTSKNAIKLMRNMGYDREIVEEALRIVDDILKVSTKPSTL